MTTPRDDAAITAAAAEARDEMNALLESEAASAGHRARRDAAILKMNNSGSGLAEIVQALGLPKSTVRQAIKSALIRAAQG